MTGNRVITFNSILKDFFSSRLVMLALLIAIALTGTAFYQSQSQKTNADYLRLHVIANSDSAYDQQVKLLVRDALLDKINPVLHKANSRDEAMAALGELLPELTEYCNEFLQGLVPYRSHMELGESSFPTKSYYELTLPAGEYQALKVVLGEGQGKNWWCVLFPPLCFIDSASVNASAPVMQGQSDQDFKPENIEIRFKIREWLGKGN
ncbi:MAG: stage II sporulation protein R [Clostridiales bacterium]|jgi:stage II sporulation protein R|nr:stage II sporulation protein R [Clostridiales bacterium]